MSRMLSTKMRDAAVDLAAKVFEVLPAEILSDAKTKRIAHARHYAMWLLRERAYSFPQIGRGLGRDQSSVQFGVRAHAARVAAGDLAGFSTESNLSVDNAEQTKNGQFNGNPKQGTMAA